MGLPCAVLGIAFTPQRWVADGMGGHTVGEARLAVVVGVDARSAEATLVVLILVAIKLLELMQVRRPCLSTSGASSSTCLAICGLAKREEWDERVNTVGHVLSREY